MSQAVVVEVAQQGRNSIETKVEDAHEPLVGDSIFFGFANIYEIINKGIDTAGLVVPRYERSFEGFQEAAVLCGVEFPTVTEESFHLPARLGPIIGREVDKSSRPELPRE